MIGSLFPEKLVYANRNYRNRKMNEVLRVLTNNINDFGDYINENADKIVGKSIMAPPAAEFYSLNINLL